MCQDTYYTNTGIGDLTNNMKIKEQPIRVLEVLGRMDRGGAETMIMNIYRKMDRTKVQLDFMVHTEDHCQFDDEIIAMGGRIYRVPRFNIINYFKYKREWKLFFKEHPEIRVIHGHMGATAAIYLQEANKAGRFSIAHSHSVDKILTVKDFIYKIMSYPTRHTAKQMFGCSAEAGIARYGKKAVSSSRYQNFPNAIDLIKFKYDVDVRLDIRKILNIAPAQSLVIHVGRITMAKNPDMILKVFKEIIKQDENAICLWVGTGELEDKYRQMIQHAGLQDRIQMTGVRPDISQLLQAADVFLFPSLWEGLPVSVIEAQATGLPCVISDTISKEVEVSPLVEWHSLTESPEHWARRCLDLAKENMGKRNSPLDSIRAAGYDINESVKRLSILYENYNKY